MTQRISIQTDLIHGKGKGAITTIVVDQNGIIYLEVLGKDAMSGRWASFSIPLTLRDLRRVNERAENAYEEEAQQHIC